MYEKEDLNCPNCNERITIYPSDQTCSECGGDIQKLKKKEAERMREIKIKIREKVSASPFQLKSIKRQKSVIRVDLDKSENKQSNSFTEVETQQELSSLIQNIKKITGVTGFEKWTGGENCSGVGSKYGMKPNLEHKNEDEVVLLVGC